jgi:hypothetical protein
MTYARTRSQKKAVQRAWFGAAPARKVDLTYASTAVRKSFFALLGRKPVSLAASLCEQCLYASTVSWHESVYSPPQ